MSKKDITSIFINSKLNNPKKNVNFTKSDILDSYIIPNKKKELTNHKPANFTSDSNIEEESDDSDINSESETDIKTESDIESDDLDDEIEEKEVETENIDDEEDITEESDEEQVKSEEYNETEDDIKETMSSEAEDEDCIYDYDEIYDSNMSESNIIVKPDDRISEPRLTTYERIRILGIRAKQISMGAKVMIKYEGNLTSIELAKLELEHKMVPLLIKRPIGNGKYEIWKISELED
jgi:DNA-directed RNA polymerase I, II, and III subunit RPABC2